MGGSGLAAHICEFPVLRFQRRTTTGEGPVPIGVYLRFGSSCCVSAAAWGMHCSRPIR